MADSTRIASYDIDAKVDGKSVQMRVLLSPQIAKLSGLKQSTDLTKPVYKLSQSRRAPGVHPALFVGKRKGASGGGSRSQAAQTVRVPISSATFDKLIRAKGDKTLGGYTGYVQRAIVK
jgi:hypothetical protein